MEQPEVESSAQEGRGTDFPQRLAKNQEATEVFVRQAYPDEKFIAGISQLQVANKWANDLEIPKHVKLAVSRIPANKEQRDILEKELRQARMLAELGNSVYLTPEYGGYKKRVADAIVNGAAYEFRNVTGRSRQIEQLFSDAKTKGKATNVFINIDSDISKQEARRRIGMVIERHPDYTGKILIAFKGKNICLWDTDSFK